MSEAKHTPGPWEARIQRNKEGRDLGWIVEHSNGRIGWASLAYADINEEAKTDDPAREANALLIAAAPELLEALKNSLQFAEACHRMTDDKLIREAIGGDIMKAREAIAKAEGRS